MAEKGDKIILKSCKVQATAAQVWKKWTSPEGISSFFAPQSKIELKVGGAFEMYFVLDQPEGLRGAEGCRVLSYVPEKMLSFSWNAPPHLPEVRNHPHKTHVVILMREVSGQTQVDLYHLGWKSGGQWDETYNYFDVAWGRVVTNLKNAFES